MNMGLTKRVSSGPSVLSRPSLEGLTHYYPLNEQSQDYCVDTVGGASMKAHFGQAVYFDGTNFGQGIAPFHVSTFSKIRISFMFQSHVMPSTSRYDLMQCGATGDDAGTSNGFYISWRSSNNITLCIGTSTWRIYKAITVPTMTIDTWYRIDVTIDIAHNTYSLSIDTLAAVATIYTGSLSSWTATWGLFNSSSVVTTGAAPLMLGTNPGETSKLTGMIGYLEIDIDSEKYTRVRCSDGTGGWMKNSEDAEYFILTSPTHAWDEAAGLTYPYNQRVMQPAGLAWPFGAQDGVSYANNTVDVILQKAEWTVCFWITGSSPHAYEESMLQIGSGNNCIMVSILNGKVIITVKRLGLTTVIDDTIDDLGASERFVAITFPVTALLNKGMLRFAVEDKGVVTFETGKTWADEGLFEGDLVGIEVGSSTSGAKVPIDSVISAISVFDRALSDADLALVYSARG